MKVRRLERDLQRHGIGNAAAINLRREGLHNYQPPE
jgi:hypothetical protein